jgi:putative oxidoreductase
MLANYFNFHDELSVVRIICGLFFIPHIYAKFFVPAALGFFEAARFNPARLWMYVAAAVEIILAIGLIFGFYTVVAGWIACLHLLVAAAAIYRVSGHKWLWNIGGCEFAVFWATCCALVAVHEKSAV